MGKKRWEDGEVHALIDYLSAHLDAYTTAVKERFYAAAKQSLDGDGYTKTTVQIKTKLIELDSSHKTDKLKLNPSGFGVEENDPASIKAMLQKKCPYYYEWDAILGGRHNTTPPVLMEPGRVVIAADAAAAPSPSTTDTASASAAVGSGVLPSPSPSPSKRPYAATQPTSLHEALMQIHAEKSERREKRHKQAAEHQEEQLHLQRQQIELQREELRLREKKMDQHFEPLRMQFELERERVVGQRLRGADSTDW